MTKSEFKKEAQKRVEKTLEKRRELGSLKDEPDDLVGAMVVLALVNEVFFDSTEDKSTDIIPPAWVFAPMQGESIFDS